MIHLELLRLFDFGKETQGVMYVIDDDRILFTCTTLELPWKDNQRRISCIPAGKYDIRKYSSPSKGRVFLLEEVPNRSFIEIHSGNFHFDVLGCILVGDATIGHVDINGDGLLDVVNSKNTLNHLLDIVPEKSTINIKYRN